MIFVSRIAISLVHTGYGNWVDCLPVRLLTLCKTFKNKASIKASRCEPVSGSPYNVFDHITRLPYSIQ